MTQRRLLGSSNLRVGPVGFGCWPIAGVSSLGVNDADSLLTIHAALDAGCNFIDTAFSYGFDGEADKLLAQVLRDRRSEVVLASKVGSHYDAHRRRTVDGRPETLIGHAELALRRLGVEQVDVMYLHEVDPQVPIEASAAGIAEILARGWARYAGVSNVDAEQLCSFHRVCPVVVVQPPFNMLQQNKVLAIRELCIEHNIGLACYWVLMKGLLAGKLPRDHRFDPADRRLTYPIYQGQAWQQSQDLLDSLRGLASELGCSVAQLVIAWTVAQPGVTVALCGAKRATQIEETAAAMDLVLTPEVLRTIDGWLVSAAKILP